MGRGKWGATVGVKPKKTGWTMEERRAMKEACAKVPGFSWKKTKKEERCKIEY